MFGEVSNKDIVDAFKTLAAIEPTLTIKAKVVMMNKWPKQLYLLLKRDVNNNLIPLSTKWLTPEETYAKINKLWLEQFKIKSSSILNKT